MHMVIIVPTIDKTNPSSCRKLFAIVGLSVFSLINSQESFFFRFFSEKDIFIIIK